MASRRGSKRKKESLNLIDDDIDNIEIYKDLTTRFKPIDDLALLINMKQTADILMVHKGVKFSCVFKVSELQRRWNLLMLNSEVTVLALNRIRNLHPEVVLMIKKMALYSKQEDETLAQLKSTLLPELKDFEKLLNENPLVFYETRTPKELYNYWHVLKQNNLLDDQVVHPNKFITYDEIERSVKGYEPMLIKDPSLQNEIRLRDRQRRREIKKLQNEILSLDQVIYFMKNKNPEFDEETVAVLQGGNYRFPMRFKNLDIGKSKLELEDLHLPLGGLTSEASHVQGSIEMLNDSMFILTNKGRTPIFVNGSPVLSNERIKLKHDYAIQICNLILIFKIVCQHNNEIPKVLQFGSNGGLNCKYSDSRKEN